MKNVNHSMTEQQTNTTQRPSYAAPELSWVEEWVPLSAVIQHQPLQARKKLDMGAVRTYANMTKEGSRPPPVKVARCAGRLYLLDGWHRMAAGALQLREDPMAGELVLAVVADMHEDRMPWEAASANMGHGVQYKKSEHRPVFKAWIKAKQHHKGRREYMSYREMAEAFGMGVSYVTLRKWVMADHPNLAHALSRHDHGNEEAGRYTPEVISMEKQHSHEARKALAAARQQAEALEDAENRWDVLQGLKAMEAMLLAKGVKPPQF